MIKKYWKKALLVIGVTGVLIWISIQFVWSVFMAVSPSFLWWTFITPDNVFGMASILTSLAVTLGVALFLVTYKQPERKSVEPEILRPEPKEVSA